MKPRRAMGRIFVRTGVFLLLGAIVTIAVAWGCAGWMPVTANPKTLEVFDGVSWVPDRSQLNIWLRQPQFRNINSVLIQTQTMTGRESG